MDKLRAVSRKRSLVNPSTSPTVLRKSDSGLLMSCFILGITNAWLSSLPVWVRTRRTLKKAAGRGSLFLPMVCVDYSSFCSSCSCSDPSFLLLVVLVVFLHTHRSTQKHTDMNNIPTGCLPTRGQCIQTHPHIAGLADGNVLQGLSR